VLKGEALQFKKCMWALHVEVLKDHEAVVKKEFQLRKVFNFFKNVY